MCSNEGIKLRDMFSFDKNISKELLLFAIPAIIESVLVTFMQMVDTYMVSGLGPMGIAAVGITTMPFKVIMLIFFAINIATSAFVARKLGEGSIAGANGIIRYAFKLTVILSISLSIISIVFAGPIMKLNGASSDIYEQAVDYFRIIVAGCILSNMSLFFNAVKRGCHNSKVSMYSNIVANIVNIIFDYLLIGGKLGFPHLGVGGAAIATVMGYVAACIVSVIFMNDKNNNINLKGIFWGEYSKDEEFRESFKNQLKVLILEYVGARICFMLISAMCARIGTGVFAADKVGMIFLDIVFAFGGGIQSAVLSYVGNSTGAKDVKKMKKYAVSGLQIGMGIAVLLSLVFFFFGIAMFSIYFEPESELLQFGVIISRISAIIVLVQTPQLILNGIVKGAGDVKYSFYASTVSLVLLVIIDFVFIFPMGLGLTGKWIGTMIAQSIWFMLLFSRLIGGKIFEITIK